MLVDEAEGGALALGERDGDADEEEDAVGDAEPEMDFETRADAVADTRKAGVAAAFARAAKKGEGTLAPEPKKVKPAARPPPPGKRKPPPTPPAPRARGQAALHAFLTPAPAKRPKQADHGG